MWINKLNGNIYIESYTHLKHRFLEYFNTNYLLRESSMVICTALLKHGYSQFSLEII